MKSAIKKILYVFVVCTLTSIGVSCSSGSDNTIDKETTQREQETEDKVMLSKLVGTWESTDLILTINSDYTVVAENQSSSRADGGSTTGKYKYTNGVLTIYDIDADCMVLGLTKGEETSFKVTIDDSSSSLTLMNTETNISVTLKKKGASGDSPYPIFPAQNWTSKVVSSYSETMTVFVVLPDSLIPTSTSSDEIAVLCGEEVRGTLTYEDAPAVWAGMVHGEDNDILKIGYYSTNSQHLYYADTTFSFSTGGNAHYGSYDNPIKLGFTIVTK